MYYLFVQSLIFHNNFLFLTRKIIKTPVHSIAVFVYIIIYFLKLHICRAVFDNLLNHVIYKINDAFYNVFYFKK